MTRIICAVRIGYHNTGRENKEELLSNIRRTVGELPITDFVVDDENEERGLEKVRTESGKGDRVLLVVNPLFYERLQKPTRWETIAASGAIVGVGKKWHLPSTVLCMDLFWPFDRIWQSTLRAFFKK